MKVKTGIILTGGTGSRLFPLTSTINKHLLTINNKFIIDYPIQTLKEMGIENLIVVLGGNHFEQIVAYLKGGEDLGLNITYVYQSKPQGIAHAINLCKNYLKDDKFCVILGDNIYSKPIKWNSDKDRIVLHEHPELKRFGVASIKRDKIIKIEEKPKSIDYTNCSNYAITGCYMLDNKFFDYFQQIKPSARGEFEITEILHHYLKDNDLAYTFTENLWSDAGTFESISYISQTF